MNMVRIKSLTLACMTICVNVTCDPLAAETCLTVKPPTDLVCVFVGNQTEY